MKHILILNEPPYDTIRSCTGLRLCIALPNHVQDAQVIVFLMADVVACAGTGAERNICRYEAYFGLSPKA